MAYEVTMLSGWSVCFLADLYIQNGMNVMSLGTMVVNTDVLSFQGLTAYAFICEGKIRVSMVFILLISMAYA
jgi:hypothetical protein